jgi:hypothetical protein
MAAFHRSSGQTPAREGAPRASAEELASDPPVPPPPSHAPWKAIRLVKVAQAKRLLRNPKYPSDHALRAVARVLARNWRFRK